MGMDLKQSGGDGLFLAAAAAALSRRRTSRAKRRGAEQAAAADGSRFHNFLCIKVRVHHEGRPIHHATEWGFDLLRAPGAALAVSSAGAVNIPRYGPGGDDDARRTGRRAAQGF